MRSPGLSYYLSYEKQRPATEVAGPGAAARIRTGDLILTKDALYLLSYSSILYPTGFDPWGVATEKGLEPSTSSVTG